MLNICSVLGRVMDHQPTYVTVFFLELKNVYNEIKNKNEVLPPYVKLQLPQSGIEDIPLSVFFFLFFFFKFKSFCIDTFWPQLKKICSSHTVIIDIYYL